LLAEKRIAGGGGELTKRQGSKRPNEKGLPPSGNWTFGKKKKKKNGEKKGGNFND